MPRIGELLQQLTQRELRHLADRRGLAISGTKGELKERLARSYRGGYQAFAEDLSREQLRRLIELPGSAALPLAEVRRRAIRDWVGRAPWTARGDKGRTPTAAMPPADQSKRVRRLLETLTLAELRDLARRRSLADHGTRAQLLRRIARSLADDPATLAEHLPARPLRRLLGLSGGDATPVADLRELAIARWTTTDRKPDKDGGRTRRLKKVSNEPPPLDPLRGTEAEGWEKALSFAFDKERAEQLPWDYQWETVAALNRRVKRARPGAKYFVRIAAGGGKTRVINDWIATGLTGTRATTGKPWRVLWISKDWQLLAQAAADLCQRYEDAPKWIGRVGGPAGLKSLGEKRSASIVYSSIQTWVQRRRTDFRRQRFDVVIIDEVHWGEGRPSYEKLLRRYREQAVFVGMTATPRSWSDFTPIGRGLDFADLVDRDVLARPILETVSTGVAWAPMTAGTRGDFRRDSLSELARSDRRNRLLVKTYTAEAMRYGKTLVFACDIDHAHKIARAFRRAGVAAEALHADLSPAERAQVIRRFRTPPGASTSELRVLVNVAMLIHGIDIPDIDTVFLARPTASDILFAQMIGRGARRIEGRKERFHVVDFVDNLEAHEDLLVTSERYFGEAYPPAVRARSRKKKDTTGETGRRRRESRRVTRKTAKINGPRGPELARHRYEPASIVSYPGPAPYEAFAGFDLQPAQTFGVEIELTRADFAAEMPADWRTVATALGDALRQAKIPTADEPIATYHPADRDLRVWNVEWDRSCGWEITSRVLRGVGGVTELADATNAIASAAMKLGLRVNYRTGLHVHLAWKPNARRLARLLGMIGYYEPALFSLIAPSRWDNEYAEPLAYVAGEWARRGRLSEWEKAVQADADTIRFRTVNLLNLFRGTFGTIEIRMHNGTLQADKVIAWLSLWMRMLEAVDRGIEAPASTPDALDALPEDDLPLATSDRGDIVALCERVNASASLREFLHARRRRVCEQHWIRHPEYRRAARRLARQ